MISFDEAVELIGSVARPLGTQTILLHKAPGRVLAAPLVAQINSPRSDVSAMDGYAIREEDLSRLPARLNLVGQSFAGGGWKGRLIPGTCVRIFTGAPVPGGADRVIIQENVRREDDVAIIEDDPGTARHIRERGSDFAEGDELLPIGRFLDPRAIVAAAGADVARLEVFRQPRVAILGTGDELAQPGAAREHPHLIPESVTFGVAALAESWGAICVDRKRLPDDLESMQRAAGAAVQAADVVVVTGGASVGEKDFAKAMFEPLGLDLVFSKVSIKPGKPVWLGRIGERFIVGLPGNPSSALVTARLLLVPLLCGLTGRPIDRALAWRMLPLATELGPCGGRETFHRASVDGGLAKVLSFQDSSAQKALAQADILVRQAAASEGLAADEMVQGLEF